MSSYQAKKPAFLEDYVNVNERVAKFYDRFPDGRITTNYQLIDDLIIFQAQVYRQPDDAQPSATGTAMDKINVNDSSTEKTETASVGRALAFLNFETKRGMASREEMERHTARQAPRPMESRPSTPSAGGRATPAQERAIKALCASLKRDCAYNFQAMTETDAGRLIKELNEIAEAKRG